MRKVMIVAVVAAGLAGCAKAPDQIQAGYVSDVSYRPLSCADLAGEEAKMSAALAKVSAKQQETANNDAVGVFLIGVPLGSVAGQNAEAEVARLKGEIDAVQRTRQAKRCPGTTVAAAQ
jgi:type IV pilus biogenesis protein CpaD/CtpE